MCGKFEVEHEIYTNEYGYFVIPDAYCPECLCVLTQVIDHVQQKGNING